MSNPRHEEFERFFSENGYTEGQEPEAFAAWLARLTRAPVTGIALDLSGTVYADAPEPRPEPPPV